MDTPSLLFVIFSVIVGWLSWKLFWRVKKWLRLCALSARIPNHPKNHWFWGMAHVVETMDNFLHLRLEYVEQCAPRWLVTWMLFDHPDIFICHPSTAQTILTAKDVPKHHSLGGPYRMLMPWLGDGLLNSGGTKWARNRRLLTPAFHFDVLKPYVEIFNHVSDLFLEKMYMLSQNGTVSMDVYPMVGRATLHNMLRCTLSYDDDTVQNTGEQHPYVAAIHKLSYLLVKRGANPLHYPDIIYHFTKDYREFTANCDYVHEVATKIIVARRKEIEADPSQLNKRHLDFLDILITAKDDNDVGLTDREVRDEVDTFMFEGHDSTASAISWAFHSLAKYPDVQQKVRQEVTQLLKGRRHLTADDLPQLPYMTCFIKEVLRMFAPVPLYIRQLNKPLVMEGLTLPINQTVAIDAYLLHHNPDVWENDQEFIPERFLPENITKKDPFAFLPFSAGQRNCIGQHFAMNEIKVMVANLVCRYTVSLDPKKEAIPYAELVMRAKNGIYLYVSKIDDSVKNSMPPT